MPTPLSTFGTVDPTGVTDCAPVLQTAISTLAATGGTVQLPAGTLRLNSTITLSPKVGLVGEGRTATRLLSGIAAPMLQRLSAVPETGRGYKLDDLTLEGNGLGTIGLYWRRQYYWDITRLHVRGFTQAGIKLEAGLVGTFRACDFGDPDDITTHLMPWGVQASSLDWHSNFVQFDGCHWFQCSKWALDWDNAGFVVVRGGNAEFCGTLNDDDSGVFRFTNAAPGGTGGYAYSITDTWFERNRGFAAVYLGAPASDDVRTSLRDVFSRYNSGLKYGVFVADSPLKTRLHTSGLKFKEHTLADIRLPSTAVWEREPDTLASADVGSATLLQWGSGNSEPPPPPPPPPGPVVTILCDKFVRVTGGVLTDFADPQQDHGHYVLQLPPALGDSAQAPFSIAEAGAYQIVSKGFTKNQMGIHEVKIDGVVVATEDWYSPSLQYNSVKTIPSVTLAAGPHTLAIVVTGKHTAATAFYWALSRVTLTKL